eukprot:SAG31_NODE_2598_length_5417_cov_16.893005_2_plen_361_part_00
MPRRHRRFQEAPRAPVDGPRIAAEIREEYHLDLQREVLRAARPSVAELIRSVICSEKERALDARRDEARHLLTTSDDAVALAEVHSLIKQAKVELDAHERRVTQLAAQQDPANGPGRLSRFLSGSFEAPKPELLLDKDFLLQAIARYGNCQPVRCMFAQLQADEYTVAQFRRWNRGQSKSQVKKGDAAASARRLEQMSQSDIKEVLIAAVACDGGALKFAPKHWHSHPDVLPVHARWSDKSHVLSVTSKDGTALENMSPELQNDREVVLTAVKQNGLALKYASLRLQTCQDVVSTAIAQNTDAWQFANFDFTGVSQFEEEEEEEEEEENLLEGMQYRVSVDGVVAASASIVPSIFREVRV